MEYLIDNKEWIFSGVGIAVITVLSTIVKLFFGKKNMNTPNNSQYQQSSGSVQANGGVQITNNYYGAVTDKVTENTETRDINNNSVTSNVSVNPEARLFMIRIYTRKNNWLDNIRNNPKEKIVYEHNSGPNPHKDMRAGDYVCIYDEKSKIHLTGIVEAYKYFSINNLLRYNKDTTNIGFNTEELEAFIKDRQDNEADILCTVIKVKERFDKPISLYEFKNIKAISLPKLDYPIVRIQLVKPLY